MNVSDDNKKYFLLYLLCLVILFSVFVFEIPFLRWQNYDYWWIDFRNESLGNSFRSAILNLSPLDFNFDLGFDVGSTHLFPFSLPLILSPKYGVIVSNLIVLFLSFYVVVYVLERLWVTRYEAIVVSSLIFFYPAFYSYFLNQNGFNSILFSFVYAYYAFVVNGKIDAPSMGVFYFLIALGLFVADILIVIYAIMAFSIVSLVVAVSDVANKRAILINWPLLTRFVGAHIVLYCPWVVWHLSQSLSNVGKVGGLHYFLLSQDAYSFLFVPEYLSGLFLDLPPFFSSFIFLIFTGAVVFKKIYPVIFSLVLLLGATFSVNEVFSIPTYFRMPLNIFSSMMWGLFGYILITSRFSQENSRNIKLEIVLLALIFMDFYANYLYVVVSGSFSVNFEYLYPKFLVVTFVYLVRLSGYYVRGRSYPILMVCFSLLVVASLIKYNITAKDLRSTYRMSHDIVKFSLFSEQSACVDKIIDDQYEYENYPLRLLLTGTATSKIRPAYRMYRRESGIYPELLTLKEFSVIGAYRESFDAGTGKYYSSLFSSSMYHHNFPPHVDVVEQDDVLDIGATHILFFHDTATEIDERAKFSDKLGNAIIQKGVCANAATTITLYAVKNGSPFGPVEHVNNLRSRLSVEKIGHSEWSISNKSKNDLLLTSRFLPFQYQKLDFSPPLSQADDLSSVSSPFPRFTLPAEYSGTLKISNSSYVSVFSLYYYAALCFILIIVLFRSVIVYIMSADIVMRISLISSKIFRH